MAGRTDENELKSVWYWAPILRCRSGRPSCLLIQMPAFLLLVPDPDQEEANAAADRDQLGWPSDGWKAFFACSSCGFLSEYSALDVQTDLVEKQTQGKYYSGANCFCIEVECADMRCKSPACFHVEKSGADESEISTLLRRAFFFGSLPCGHAIPTHAKSIHRVMQL